jgi:uncharacterized protein YukJ
MINEIINNYSNYCNVYEQIMRDEEKDPEWNIFFKKDENFNEKLKNGLKEIPFDDIKNIFHAWDY